MTHTDADLAAFPYPAVVSQGEQHWPGHNGMTMREWYAGQALAGLIANSDLADLMKSTGLATEKAAEVCFALADAMIAESAKRTPA
jgi:hypothetical protein